MTYLLNFEASAQGTDPAHFQGYRHVVELYEVYGEDRVRFHSGWNHEAASFPVSDIDAVIGLLLEARAAAVAAGALKNTAAVGVPPCLQPSAPMAALPFPQGGAAAPTQTRSEAAA